MRIPEDIVIKLNELPIEMVAQELGVEIKRHNAKCFMHDDHTPSLKFSPKKNMYFCFVCNKGGGPIQLVQDHEGWTFQDACVWLGDKFHIWWPEDKRYNKPVRKVMKKIFLPKNDNSEFVFDGEVFTWFIDIAQLSETAKRFLFEERHFKTEVIEELKIKSVTEPKRAVEKLVSTFGEKRCLDSGIVRKSDYGLYFYFYTPCLLLPYYEKDGRLAGIQSRYLGTNAKAPRFQFMSSQKTRLFNLPILGFLKWDDELYISEGITDCLALLSSGKNAVAIPSASILPLEDLVLLKSYELHMYPDQDEAGQRAFMELRRFFVNNGTTLKAEKLPEGIKDYCDYYNRILVADGKD
ncbi:MAG: toprim domain-containing protein [Bacteroidales bacterium]|nr:toprim domain-containing protein [Bacteroidales bacterium]